MKRILAFILAVMPLCAMAQNYNEDGGKYEVYCKVVDYGNEIRIIINNSNCKFVDKNGENISAKEITEVLNLLSKRGWSLVSSFSSGTSVVGRYYIMKKEISNDSELSDGLEVKGKK